MDFSILSLQENTENTVGLNFRYVINTLCSYVKYVRYLENDTLNIINYEMIFLSEIR